MKRKIFIFILIVLSFSLFSCKDKINDSNNNQGGDSSNNEEELIPSEVIYTGYYEKMTGNFNNFFNTLNDITVKSHTHEASYSEIWTILQESDAYDENNIECLYTGRLIPKSDRDGSSSSAVVWNREHVWAKSHGFNNQKYAAYADAHHLRASEKNINSARNNSYFDEVSNGNSDIYGNTWTSDVFEPRDEVKGDVARMLFYMVTRYHDSELTLTLDNTGTYPSQDGNGTLGKLSTLVKWHYEDPVDEKEEKRNDVVAKYQGNRNPYIDHPEFVYYLYEEESEKIGITEENVLDKVKGNVDEDDTIETLIKDIESLRNVTITLDMEATLNKLQTRYDALSPSDKTKVTNYDLLVEKINELNALKGYVSKTYDLSKAPGNANSYLKNTTFVVDGLEFYASNHGTGAGFILGANSNNYYADIDPKYNVGNWSKYSVLKFKYDNLSSISFEVTNKYSGINGVSLLYSSNDSKYEEVYSFESFEIGEKLFYDFSNSKTGYFVLVVYGTQPRLAIDSFTLTTKGN